MLGLMLYFKKKIGSEVARQARAHTFWGAGAQTPKKGHPLPKKKNSD